MENIIKTFIMDFIALYIGAIFNFVQDFVDGKITRSALWELAKFKKPTHQISFHTASALETLHFIRGVEVHGKE